MVSPWEDRDMKSGQQLLNKLPTGVWQAARMALGRVLASKGNIDIQALAIADAIVASREINTDTSPPADQEISEFILRLSNFFPPQGFWADRLLPSECRKEYEHQVSMAKKRLEAKQSKLQA